MLCCADPLLTCPASLQEDEEDALAAEVDAQFQELFTALQAERDRLAGLQVRKFFQLFLLALWLVLPFIRAAGGAGLPGRPAGVPPCALRSQVVDSDGSQTLLPCAVAAVIPVPQRQADEAKAQMVEADGSPLFPHSQAAAAAPTAAPCRSAKPTRPKPRWLRRMVGTRRPAGSSRWSGSAPTSCR